MSPRTRRTLQTRRAPQIASDGRTGILVAGMHRSGTSALTRVLTLAGCDLPRTLVEAKPDNVAGFWESQLVVDLNDEILASVGSCWDDWRPFDRDWYESPAAGPFRDRALDVLRQEYGESRLFVLKDPRICRLLPFWTDALARLDVQPCAVLPIRSPLDVAASLETRNEIDPFVAYLIWLRHVLDAEADSRGLPRAHVRYDQLLSDAPASLDRICGDLSLSLPLRAASSMEMDIDAFLSPDLRHHWSEDDGLLSDTGISEWVTGSFRIFEKWTRGEADAEYAGELDRIRAAFDAAAPAFGRALQAGQQARREYRAVARQMMNVSETLETTRQAVAERDRRLDEQNQRLTDTWKKLEAARHTLTERKQELTDTSKKLEAARHTLTERKQELTDTSKKLEAARHTLTERKQELTDTSKKLEAARHTLTERNQRLTATWQQLEATRRTLADRERLLAASGKQLEAAREVVAGQEARIAELTADLDAARRGHLLALARHGRRRRIDLLEVVVRPTPEWLAEARGRGPGPALELRRNGRVVARAAVPEGPGDTLRIPVALSQRGAAEALYSVHDAATGAALAALTAPALWHARAVEGAVENRPQPEIRGWLLDPAHPHQPRRVAIEVDGRLCDVIVAGEPRDDIARWKGTDGCHGFLWRVPSAAAEGARVDVFDADTGRPLRGSPVHVADGQAAAAGTDEA